MKYDSNAITSAASDIYKLLTDKQKQKVNNGDFQDNIISYAYPDDLVSTFNHHAIGSTYYLSDPRTEDLSQSFKNHPMKNYTKKDLFDKDGYFIPESLYTHGVVGQPEVSPLKLKNSGVEGFNVLIKTSIMKLYSQQVEKNADLVENTKKDLVNFLDYYEDSMKEMKDKYIQQIGSEGYELLNLSDVDDLFYNLGHLEQGIPFIFNKDDYEEIVHHLAQLQEESAEIAFHMEKMSRDFEAADKLLAEWIKF